MGIIGHDDGNPSSPKDHRGCVSQRQVAVKGTIWCWRASSVEVRQQLYVSTVNLRGYYLKQRDTNYTCTAACKPPGEAGA